MLDQHAAEHHPFESGGLDAADDEITLLEKRLERGWQVITAAEQRGESTDRLLDHFTELLRRYESLYDRQSAA